ncbi:helix-turn-helix transcriptional regulator [Microbacterium gorillae]|uniref:helix-turn-helix transcriptional regulator n=1 Tax=Microbacterium gorillae TaxID=1231063 RepID=UPI00058E0B18|nr:LuxR C-terminal-related transcriptional regulator [Microbacterium gorillae]
MPQDSHRPNARQQRRPATSRDGSRPVVLPSLAPTDQPERLLAEAFESGNAVFSVSGVSGSGKSVLGRQILAQSRRPGPVRWRAVSVAADEFRHRTPYAVADQLIRDAAPARRRAGATERPEASPAASLLSVADRLLTALMRGVSTRRRLLLMIDDVQWADDDSIRALRVVVGRLPAEMACVVLIGRDPRTRAIAESLLPTGGAQSLSSRPITVDSLDVDGVRGYMSAVHGIEVSRDLAERVRRASGGLPLLIDQVALTMAEAVATRAAQAPGTRARFDEDLTDALESGNFTPVNPFAGLGAELPDGVRAAMEVAATLHSPLREADFVRIGELLAEPVDVRGALATGLLVRRPATAPQGAPELAVFHDLYGADVADHLYGGRRAAILNAGAQAVPGGDSTTRHRALLWRLDAAIVQGTPLAGDLFADVRTAVAENTRARNVEHVFDAMQRGIELAGRHDPALSDELVVALYALSTALSCLPRMIEWIPRLTEMPRSDLRDLALLHVREFRGDYDWADAFGADLLRNLPRLPEDVTDLAPAPGMLAAGELSGLIVRMHTSLILGLLAPQARPGDFGLEHFDEARTVASWLIAVQQREPELWDAASERLDPRFRWLPTAHDVQLRAIGMSLFGVSSVGPAERVQAEVAALSHAIATAPDQTPTLSDARLIRAGIFSTIGYIRMAAADLDVCMRMLRDGTAGWGTGTARTMHMHAQYLLGDIAEVEDTADEAAAVILDDMDAVGRPGYFALRAVLAAGAGDVDGWRASMTAAAQVTSTSYDAIGAEYELLAHIALARAERDPAAQLAAFAPDGLLAGRLLRNQNLYAYRVDALATLGRADEAQLELDRLRALPAPGFQPVYGSIAWLTGRVHEAHGRFPEAISSYRAGADPTSGEELPGVLAQASFDAGRLMLQVGSGVSGARRYLRAARRGFAALRLIPAAAEATALLDAAQLGAPLGRASILGPDDAALTPHGMVTLSALTPREREIAVLAAQGLTNAAIGENLHIGAKTVAVHMGKVLAKLEMNSRRQLRTVLDSAGSATVPAERDENAWATLSPREREVAGLLTREFTDAEIADALGISARTVGAHVGVVLGKLALSSRRELWTA